MTIAAGFLVHDDNWILPRKLHALSQFCDRIVVMLDRCPDEDETILICRRYPMVRVFRHHNTLDLPEQDENGPFFEQGIMMQKVWNILASERPRWIILGDADEIPTPDIVGFLKHPPCDADVFYLHWVHLYKSPLFYIGGDQSPYSFECAKNKKGAIVKFDIDKHKNGEYQYDQHEYQHLRLEPSPLHPKNTVYDDKHVLVDTPKLIHFRFANWPRWTASEKSKSRKYRDYFSGMKVKRAPKEWFWDGDQS